jgi:UPF0716 family protein affecting phage T7 exclusion
MLLKALLLVAIAAIGLLAVRARLLRRFPRMKSTPVDRAFARAGQSTANGLLAAVALAAGFLVLLHLLDRL